MIHFAGLPIPPKVLGVCAECGKGEIEEEGGGGSDIDGNDNGNGNVLLLCDGPGCDREFHLKCCSPPLSEVPEEDYFCFDCHPNGGHATTLLEDYLDETERDREAHNEDCEDYYYNNYYSYCEPSLPLSLPAPPESIPSSSLPSSNHHHHHHHHLPNPSYTTTSSDRTRSPSNKSSSSFSSVVATTPAATRRRRRTSQNKHGYNFDAVDSASASASASLASTTPTHHPNNKRKTNNNNINNNSDSKSKSKLPHETGTTTTSGDTDQRYTFDLRRHLVGCVLRLFCTKTNSYHTGRILSVKQRRQQYHDARDLDAVETDPNDTECLVRFPAGRDHRKRNVTRWIRLEEHSLAVACPDLVWGKFVSFPPAAEGATRKRKKSSAPRAKQQPKQPKHCWMPTKLWMRSSRELVMSIPFLNELRGQIRYRSFREYASAYASGASSLPEPDTTPGARKSRTSQPQRGEAKSKSAAAVDLARGADTADNGSSAIVSTSASANARPYLQQEWILAECIGRGIYNLAHVPSELKEHGGEHRFLSPYPAGNAIAIATTAATTGSKRSSQKKTGNIPHNAIATTTPTGGFRPSPRDEQVMTALVQAEREERDRVRRWNDLPLNNAWHPKALTCLDEYALGPLNYDHGDCGIANPNPGGTPAVIEPSPLLRTGLDRMYIMDRMITQSIMRQQDDETPSYWTSDVTGARSKDLAMSLACDLVCNDFITAHIQDQNRLARSRHKHPQDQDPEQVKSGPTVESPPKLTAATKTADETTESELESKMNHVSEKTEPRDAAAATDAEKAESIHSEIVILDTAIAEEVPQPLKSPTSSTGVSPLLEKEMTTKSDKGPSQDAALVTVSLSLT
eukprot:jgi/Psemu1/321914/estExt_fgenesh1_pg.C_130047